jgi:hypothetical protein
MILALIVTLALTLASVALAVELAVEQAGKLHGVTLGPGLIICPRFTRAALRRFIEYTHSIVSHMNKPAEQLRNALPMLPRFSTHLAAL